MCLHADHWTHSETTPCYVLISATVKVIIVADSLGLTTERLGQNEHYWLVGCQYKMTGVQSYVFCMMFLDGNTLAA